MESNSCSGSEHVDETGRLSTSANSDSVVEDSQTFFKSIQLLANNIIKEVEKPTLLNDLDKDVAAVEVITLCADEKSFFKIHRESASVGNHI